MTAAGDAGNIDRREVFISRAGSDKDVAIAIRDILQRAGYMTYLQDDDFGHANFMARMRDGFAKVEGNGCVLALLSRAYMASEYCLTEAEYPLIGDTGNRREKLIVLRIEECAPTGFLKGIARTDLVPLLNNAAALEKVILGAIDPKRDKAAADMAAFYRRSATQIIHNDVRAVPGFTAREDELRGIDAALWTKGGKAALTNSNNASAAVKGLGGVGKSVLAQQYAWSERAKYKGVWWLRAERNETLLDDLIELGCRFNPGIGEMPDRAQAAKVVLDFLAQQDSDKPWLLVYDNVENPDALDGLTPANNAHVLITTRWQDWHGHAQELPVGVFKRDTAIAFLMEQARGLEHDAESVRAAAGRLADDLGCLPLALSIARAQAWSMGWSFDTYRARIAEMLKRDPPKGVDYDNSVYATFTAALDKAIASAPQAEMLMGVCAFLAPDRIPLSIFIEPVFKPIELGEAVAALAELSLVTREILDDGSTGISVHRLVQEVMKDRLGGARDNAAALATMLVARAYPFDSDYPEHWPTCRRLEPHAMAVLAVAPETGDAARSTTRLLGQHAIHLKARADFAAAEPLHRRALAIDEVSLGPYHPNVAIRLNNLAQLLQATNRLSEAEPLMRRALAIGEANFDRDHPTIAIHLSNLARLFTATNRPSEAEPLMRRALTIDEASLGADHPNVAIRLNNLAALLHETNRSFEAEPLMRRALAIVDTSFGQDHPNVAVQLNNLAVLVEEGFSNYKESETLKRRALAIDEASLGPNHPNLAIRLSNLATLLRATDRLSKAEPLMHRALAIFEASLGPDHPNTQTARANYATLRAAMDGKS